MWSPGSPTRPGLASWGGIMPEHIHLLIGGATNRQSFPGHAGAEATCFTPVSRKEKSCETTALHFQSTVATRILAAPSHDFNVRTKKKYCEKLNYIHMNPVRRGLVNSPELWPWSSFREKRGQPELSDFFCTILAHAAPKSMCVAGSTLPHYTAGRRPL